VVDVVVQKLARKPVHPVIGGAQNHFAERTVQVVSKPTVDVDHVAENPGLDQIPDVLRRWVVAVGMSNRQLPARLLDGLHERPRVLVVRRQRFFDIQMTPGVERHAREWKMAGRRRT
jgi:hypothetical protein